MKQMPFVNNGDLSIFYKTVGNPANPPLLLLHWFMGSHQTWYDIGWVRLLEPQFYLIMVDHRGYGKSSKPHNPSYYAPSQHVSDMEAVLDKLEIETTHIMGYSMGARIGFAMMVYAPYRIRTAVLGGMHAYSSEHIPTDLERRIELLKQGMEATLNAYKIGPQQVFDRMAQNDAEALLADTKQTKQWEGLEEELTGYDNPVLLFVGKEDGFYQGVKEISKVFKSSRFVAFPGENHRTAFIKRTLLVPHLERFWSIKLDKK